MDEVKWLLEDYIGNDDIPRFVPELEKKNICYHIISKPLEHNPQSIPFNQSDCVVFLGSLVNSIWLKKNFGWIPGVYCHSENLKCSTYYSHWGEYLLNRDYIMIPLYELWRRWESIIGFINNGGSELFIRPNSGFKTFIGGLYDKVKLMDEIRLLGGIDCVDNITVIVSSPKKIDAEWRIVIADRIPVTSSMYMKNGEFCVEEGCPLPAELTAEIMGLSPWQPENCYVVDICLSEGKYHLLEVNSFSCSGFYLCNASAIIDSVSKSALEEWKEYNKV